MTQDINKSYSKVVQNTVTCAESLKIIDINYVCWTRILVYFPEYIVFKVSHFDESWTATGS